MLFFSCNSMPRSGCLALHGVNPNKKKCWLGIWKSISWVVSSLKTSRMKVLKRKAVKYFRKKTLSLNVWKGAKTSLGKVCSWNCIHRKSFINVHESFSLERQGTEASSNFRPLPVVVHSEVTNSVRVPCVSNKLVFPK